MSLANRLIDPNATHRIELDGTVYVVKRVTMEATIRYVDDNVDPALTGKAAEDAREKLMNDYFIEHILVSIEDEQLPDTPELRLAIFTDPAFADERIAIRNGAFKTDNFRMTQEAARKKFSSIGLKTKGRGKKRIAETG